MSLNYFEFNGNPYQQGLAHGECLKESIKNNIEIYFTRFNAEAGIQKNDLLNNAAIYLNILRKQSPDYVNGINGIANSSNLNILEIAMLNIRYELFYHALGKLQIDNKLDGCTSFALSPAVTSNNHLIIGQNWDWIPNIECALIKNTDIGGLTNLVFTEAGIFGGKPGINSKGIGFAINGMFSTDDDFTRFEKPFHLRCYETMKAENMQTALSVLTDSQRSCTANFIIGHAPRQVVDIELAPNNFRLIDPADGIISHANHFDNIGMIDTSEPPNPKRCLSQFRQKRMFKLLNENIPLDIKTIQKILMDHANKPQSICRHRDDNMPESQHIITKTSIIMDLAEKRLWISDGQPCKSKFIEYSVIV